MYGGSLMKRWYVYIVICTLVSCNLTKFVPEDKYLLYKEKVVLEDNEEVSSQQLTPYLRQTPNTEILGCWKLPLHMYNTSPLDTTKRRSRTARRVGEAPVIYDDALTAVSRQQITQAMKNKGYFDATVDTSVITKKQKLYLTYHVTANAPYHICDYKILIPQENLNRIANSFDSKIHVWDVFSSETLDDERTRITMAMRDKGFYFFEKSFLRFEVDSSVNEHIVGVHMRLDESLNNKHSKFYHHIFSQQRIRNVYFHTDYNPKYAPDSLSLDSSQRGAYHFIWHEEEHQHKLLKDRFLIKHCGIKPGELYNETAVNSTYSKIGSLSAVKYVNITFEPTDDEGQLDCHIVLSRSKLNHLFGEVEGTYSDGDWGVLVGIGYTHRNAFKKSTQFSFSNRVGYEWRNNGSRATEVDAKVDLKFPSTFDIGLMTKYQFRPDEFTRTIFNLSFGYTHRTNPYLTHQFTFTDWSFVYLPKISDAFRETFLRPTNILKYSYEDHFIWAWNYALTYNAFNKDFPNRSYGSVRFYVETAGNVLYGISKLLDKADKTNHKAFGISIDDNGNKLYTIFGVNYSQYVKSDIALTYNSIFSDHQRLVWHFGLGVAFPYGNGGSAATVPFEKRYFSGGANSVRGWTARSLGPGAYVRKGTRIEYNNQAGDIKLDLNIEYRLKIWNFIHTAAFIDAGNIWTIRDYPTQPEGAFHFNSFLKQMALSYGVGIRLDFSFITVRLDMGVKLHDPSRTYEGKAWRTIPNGLRWKDDCALHIAVGYPF